MKKTKKLHMSSTLSCHSKQGHSKITQYPKHVGIIMDGNRRWARNNNLPSYMGHKIGAEKVVDIIQSAKKMGLETLTLFVFSTENWRRSKFEVRKLMALLFIYLKSYKKLMIDEGIKLHIIGDTSKLPKLTQRAITEVISATSEGSSLELVLAVNYGSRDEITRAIKAMMRDCANGKLGPEDVTEIMIKKYLDTSQLHDPELIIRTSGEQRLSNFLLWQSCYTEFYVTDKKWPEFEEQDLVLALEEYNRRERRLGGA
jgi:undecaprenyl diphosphate synthase